MTLNYFIGIDVSKSTLDFSVRNSKEVIYRKTTDNSLKGIKAVIKDLRKLPDFTIKSGVFCMEHTGIYNQILLDVLFSMKSQIWLEAALRIKQSQGMTRGKNDQVDADRIAEYAYLHRDKMKLWQPQREQLIQLKKLIGGRERLINCIKQLTVPINENRLFDTPLAHKKENKRFKGSIQSLKKDLMKIEQEIQALVHSDDYLKNLFILMTSISGIGAITAVNVMICTNEFKSFDNPKKFACYCGVAPFEHQSGSSIRGRTRVSHLANKKIKTLLHLAAMAAINSKGELQDYYQKKIAEGKNKMSAINAIRNKLISRIFAVVKRGTAYEKKYQLALV